MDNQKKNTFYITTPIFYPNANLHMGHAYTTCVSDILARYNRIIGKETYFLTGADENTEKVVRAAKIAGEETQAYLNKIVEGFKDLFTKLEISYDQFIRTSDKNIHWPGVQKFWKLLEKDIEKRSYEGLYCVGHESFITEKELVEGKCVEHDETPQLLKEENYFFKLSKYSEQIKDLIEKGEIEIIPHTRKNEILSLLNNGLEDISFSRSTEKVSVGIPVPGDQSQKIYVWGDALSNYITALGFGRSDDELYQKFWPVNLHVIGKDILRFHAAIWPGMLLSAGLPLPKKILVHGFITSGGRKMSKSIGNVISPLELINEYSKYTDFSSEVLRLYLSRHISAFEDGDLTIESFREAYNADLANGLGNLVSRVMKMAETNLSEPVECGDLVFDTSFSFPIEAYNIQQFVNEVWEYIGHVDALIQKEQPFKLVKENKDKGVELITELVKKLHVIAGVLQVLMPNTAEKINNFIKENKMPDKPLFLRKN